MISANRLASALTCALALSAAAATSATAASPATGGVSAPTADALSLDAGSAFVGRTVRFTGTVAPRDAGRPVQIQRRSGAGGWTTITRAVAGGDGDFSARWRTQRPGTFTVRAVVGGATQARSAEDPLPASATDHLVVYRPAMATWYGPGFYGSHTACGQTLTPTLIGVAHRTLPCGTKVRLYYKGKTIVAPVVDRGPFGRNRSFDLTYAAAQAVDLGSEGVGRVGYLTLRR